MAFIYTLVQKSLKGYPAFVAKIQWAAVAAIDVAVKSWKAQTGLTLRKLLLQSESEYETNVLEFVKTTREAMRKFTKDTRKKYHKDFHKAWEWETAKTKKGEKQKDSARDLREVFEWFLYRQIEGWHLSPATLRSLQLADVNYRNLQPSVEEDELQSEEVD
jgi:hypothetical protein